MTPFKSLPVVIAGIFIFAGLSALTSALGHSPDDKRSSYERMARYDGPPRHGRMQHRHKHGADYLAKRLSLAETEIGIRANQIDAWRDFTDAMLRVMARPSRHDWKSGTEGDTPEPFARAERLAERTIARGKAAEDLVKAIEELRRTLTPEQLAKVAEIEARMKRHHWRHSDPGPKPGESPAPKIAPDKPEDSHKPAPEAE